MLDGSAQRRASGINGRCGIRPCGRGLRHLPNPTPPQQIDTAIVSNAKQPGRQWTLIVEGLQFPIRLEEGLLHDILAVEHRSGHTRTVAVETRAKMRNRLEEREIPRLDGN